jgi:hypothetical protein
MKMKFYNCCMEIPNNVRKLIYGMFDDMIEGADKYVTKSSTWLIFTEEKRWVFEFTNTKTLWFNYNLFQSELNLLSMDCVDSKDIIKEWFESRFLEKDIAHVTDTSNVPYSIVENTIQNGVKHTDYVANLSPMHVENTIQNGVKHTEDGDWLDQDERIDDIIESGVKETKHRLIESYEQKDHQVTTLEISHNIKNAIENGVKE